jgi:signal transduction histidine kinase
VTDDAAKPARSSGQAWRSRPWASRLLQYTLLQALIVMLCVVALRQPLPEPAAGYLVNAFNLNDRGTERAVTLPDFVASRFSMNEPALYTTTFSYNFAQADAEAWRAWSIYLPRFTNGVEIIVNGIEILDSRRDSAANRLDRATPEIAVIPASLLRDGANELAIRLFVWGPISGYLDRLYVGPDEVLRPFYARRSMLFVTLPMVFAAWQGILAVILTVMGAVRRHEPAYGALAAAMALGAVQAFLPTVVDQPAYPRLDAALNASAPLESGLVLAFAILFFGRRWPRYAWLVLVPGVLIELVGLIGSPQQLRQLFLVAGIPAIGLNLVAVGLVVAWSELRRQDVPSLLLGCAVSILLTCLVHDWLQVLNVTLDRRIFFAHLSYSAMLVAIGVGLTWRFAQALNRVDGFAARLATRLHEAEEKLKASFAREEQRARLAALGRERTRLMRDLHDGLGGQLVSIVALSERGDNESAPMGEAARAALRDLRLVIDAMDDIGGDLMLALGSWRERATAQLRPHDIELDWRVVSPQGLPMHPELRPSHVIQIVRILDEALTNAVKHAGARHVKVSIETRNDGSSEACGCITVEDDGKGFAVARDGGAAEASKASRGLRNMRSRAERCGAELELESGAGGTRVRLKLPHRFPDGDAAG